MKFTQAEQVNNEGDIIKNVRGKLYLINVRINWLCF
jgi:hypothetical protein